MLKIRIWNILNIFNSLRSLKFRYSFKNIRSVRLIIVDYLIIFKKVFNVNYEIFKCNYRI